MPDPRFLPVSIVLILALGTLTARAESAPNWWSVANLLSPVGGTDFTPHGTQPGLLFPLQPAGSCGGCHGAANSSQQQYRPASTWGGSMMAQAMRDPLFWAALDVANADVPGVGDFCLRCHTPAGWYGGRVSKTGGGGQVSDPAKGAAGCLLEGTLDSADFNNDYEGVACHYCHRLSPEGPNGEPVRIGNGDAWVDDTECNGDGGEPCRRGPYTYSGSFQPPHPWAQSAFHADGAVCGSCHDVSSPDLGNGPFKALKLDDGTDTGQPFPIERTYSEWEQSAYAQPGGANERPCQSCHMPDSQDPNATAAVGGPPRTGNLPVHAFAGGNTWIPQIIRGEYSDTTSIPGSNGGIGRQDELGNTVAWAREMLASAAALEATLTAYTAPTTTTPGSLGARITVTNRSGHKLPSGYGEGRRMWLNLQVKDAAGALVFESAAYDIASATLDQDPQARVYEVLQGIWNRNGTGTCDVKDDQGRPIFHFALNDCVVKDNRIPPLGFRPATAVDPNGYQLRPVAHVYPETTPGSGVLVNHDQADYVVTLPAGAQAPFTVTARLYYQTSSREYIEFLRNQAVERGFAGENLLCAGGPNRPAVVGPKDQTRGQFMHALWETYGKSPPELMQSIHLAVPTEIFRDGFE
jgi:hypothetical protein